MLGGVFDPGGDTIFETCDRIVSLATVPFPAFSELCAPSAISVPVSARPRKQSAADQDDNEDFMRWKRIGFNGSNEGVDCGYLSGDFDSQCCYDPEGDLGCQL